MATILIIDDEENILKYLRAVLEPDGHSVLTATTGADGCRIASEKSVDLIISDLHVGYDISPMELLRKLRCAAPDKPLIVITGFSSQEIIDECKEMGVTDFLSKPYELAFLKNLVHSKLATLPVSGMKT